ncbi:hypothetical protein V6N11_068197 [Hibiscus sabdariffa]|uniref:Histone deacetylase domain-containing protein n=1 Tax=Hibiscus sabdariffa TaxID=183260 RepID=A0ABR2SSZ3_9ROSI
MEDSAGGASLPSGPDGKKRRVTYFYEPTIGDYYYGQGHPMKPHRIRMAHNLIVHYSLHRRMEINRPFPAGPADIRRFHTEEYVDFLNAVSPDSISDPTYSRHSKRFNVGEDCPVFDGIFGFCQASAGGSLGAAVKLNRGDADIAINWAGGLHHAKKSEASGFCYVNDIVLGILELLKFHRFELLQMYHRFRQFLVVVGIMAMNSEQLRITLLKGFEAILDAAFDKFRSKFRNDFKGFNERVAGTKMSGVLPVRNNHNVQGRYNELNRILLLVLTDRGRSLGLGEAQVFNEQSVKIGEGIAVANLASRLLKMMTHGFRLLLMEMFDKKWVKAIQDEKMLFNKLEMIDTCKRLISKDDTIIFEWNSDKKTIEEKYEQIGLAIALNTFDYDKEKLLEKLAKLFSEIEVSEKKNRVMDTLNATKAVVEESIMPCGDVADDIVMSMQLKDVNESSQSS